MSRKPFGFHQGDRTELYGTAILTAFGFCAPVPRQFDRFGVDVLVNIAVRKEHNLIATGELFSVQVKSNKDELFIEDLDELNCLYSLNTPFFFLVVDRKNQRFQMYSAFRRIIANFWDRKAPVRIRYSNDGQPVVRSGNELILNLGNPVIDAGISELENQSEVAPKLQSIVRFWMDWEQWHLGHLARGFPVATVPFNWQPNALPPLNEENAPVIGFCRPDLHEQAVNNLIVSLHGISEHCSTMESEGVGDAQRIKPVEKITYDAMQALMALDTGVDQ